MASERPMCVKISGRLRFQPSCNLSTLPTGTQQLFQALSFRENKPLAGRSKEMTFKKHENLAQNHQEAKISGQTEKLEGGLSAFGTKYLIRMSLSLCRQRRLGANF